MTHFYRHACRVLTLIACVACCAQTLAAQDVSDELDEFDIVSPTARGCQRNNINIANLSALLATTKERAFVVARLGTGESSHHLNRRRLNEVKSKFAQLTGANKVILAEGARVRGQGRVEFYLGSEIHFISLMVRNGDFCGVCCERKASRSKKLFRRSGNTGGRR